MANTNRGPMHFCTHTNKEWYGQTGCYACEREVEEHKHRQEKAKQEAKAERETREKQVNNK